MEDADEYEETVAATIAPVSRQGRWTWRAEEEGQFMAAEKWMASMPMGKSRKLQSANMVVGGGRSAQKRHGPIW